MSAPQLFTVPEVAGRLRYSRRQVDRLIASGRLRAIRIGPAAHWRVREDDLERFLSGLETNEPTYRRPAARRHVRAVS